MRLSGRDAAFLYEEGPARPMHTVKLIGLGGERIDVAALRELIRPRLLGLAPLRRRLVTVPGNLYHPVWIDAGLPDLKHHVRACRVSAPGDQDQLWDLIADLGANVLDRGLPLWELWLADGVADGGQALIFKLHHALGHASTSRRLIQGLLGPQAPALDGAVEPDPAPGRFRLIRDAVVDLSELVSRTPALARSALALRAGIPPPTRRLPTRAGAGSGRTCAFVHVPLAALDRLARDRELTITELVLSIVAVAARQRLLEQAALPSRPLIAAVPRSVPGVVPAGTWGNQLATLFVSLATDTDDPQARELQISAGLRAAAARQAAIGPGPWRDWWDAYPLRRLAYVIAFNWRPGARLSSPYDLLVSSVRGGAERLARDRIRVDSVGSLGTLPPDGECAVTAWSYADAVVLGILTAAGSALEARSLARSLTLAFAERGVAALAPGGAATSTGHGAPGSAMAEPAT